MARVRFPPGPAPGLVEAGPLIMGRTDVARALLHTGCAEGRRICALGCGDFGEGDRLIGRDLSNVTLVDLDRDLLEHASKKHRLQIVAERIEPLAFLSRCHRRHEQFDLIYSLYLPETLSDPALVDLMRSIGRLLTPSGEALIANACEPIDNHSLPVAPHNRHFARSHIELSGVIGKAGFTADTWLDTSESNAFALIKKSRHQVSSPPFLSPPIRRG